MSVILVVDNEKSMREMLTIWLEKEGYEVMTADNGLSAGQLIKENPLDLVITDIRMPRSNGIDVLDTVKEVRSNTPVVMMTAYASAETAVEAMKKGAYDYISKPFKIEDLQLIVKNALEKKKLSDEKKQLVDENRLLKSALKDKYQYSNIIGKSSAMSQVFEMIDKVAESNVTVLITGESGTGKELVARAIHFNGSRRNYPFVSVNCGAMPETLLESELFGHEKGAFTSADSVKVGLMEAANKGSFFLDEVGETPLSIQVKLLRVLQEKEFTRVGGTKPIRVDLRIIAATNQDLGQSVKDKTFREDLFYRLNVIYLNIPPLRERKGDIPLLVDFFIKKYNHQHEHKPLVKGIDPEAMEVLEKYHWPGNVRELENTIERAVVLEMGEMIRKTSIPEEVVRGATGPLVNLPATADETVESGGQENDRNGNHSLPVDFVPLPDHQPIDLEKVLQDIEKKMILKALKQTDGIMNKAAKLLNVSSRSMRYLVQKYQLKKKLGADD